MSEKPILFSGPMVRALLAGTKTQTRRIVKPYVPPSLPTNRAVPRDLFVTVDRKTGERIQHRSSPYQPGDVLWVRERWAAHFMYDDVLPIVARSDHQGDNRWFHADGEDAKSHLGLKAEGYR